MPAPRAADVRPGKVFLTGSAEPGRGRQRRLPDRASTTTRRACRRTSTHGCSDTVFPRWWRRCRPRPMNTAGSWSRWDRPRRQRHVLGPEPDVQPQPRRAAQPGRDRRVGPGLRCLPRHRPPERAGFAAMAPDPGRAPGHPGDRGLHARAVRPSATAGTGGRRWQPGPAAPPDPPEDYSRGPRGPASSATQRRRLGMGIGMVDVPVPDDREPMSLLARRCGPLGPGAAPPPAVARPAPVFDS